MADPTRLLAMFPDAYHKGSGGDLYKLCTAVMEIMSQVETGISDTRDDVLYTTSDGTGLLVNGENVSIPRPPGLSESQYAILLTTMAPIPRGTLNAIKQVFEAATGYTGVSVLDKTTTPSIPDYEIWIYLSPSQSKSHGRGAYAGLTTNYALWAVESCIVGTVYDNIGLYGGEFNDHWWGALDKWTQQIVDSVRLAGTVIVYKMSA